jgi:hypothetical protein
MTFSHHFYYIIRISVLTECIEVEQEVQRHVGFRYKQRHLRRKSSWQLLLVVVKILQKNLKTLL